MKIIAFYLPQYHETAENNEWWGKGFTEWTNLKKANPLFDGHYQPRIPLNNNYYNLLNDEIQEWQCSIAKENGIYGFCFYHYWFDGHLLLHEPIERYLKNLKCDLPFCICWANEDWTKAWTSEKDTILIAQKYGDKQMWKSHFEYLLPFFKDKRYITFEQKPLLVIYRPDIIPCLNEMLDFWNILAKEKGFKGLCFAAQHVAADSMNIEKKKSIDYFIEYQPGYALRDMGGKGFSVLKKCKSYIDRWTGKAFHFTINLHKLASKVGRLDLVDYDEAWETILTKKVNGDKYIPGAFVDWDNSPRRKEMGKIFLGSTPQKFEKYLERLIVKARNEYKKDVIFIFAWNEWTEGGYLEPDEKNRYAYLKAVKNALENADIIKC